MPRGLTTLPGAKFVIVPLLTRRMSPLRESAMNTLPEESTATPVGVFNVAAVAGPPSPEEPAVPVPASVVMIPRRSARPEFRSAPCSAWRAG